MNSKALHNISYGMYLVTSRIGGKANGQTANSVFQITSKPPRLAVSINKDNYTRECIDGCGKLTISVLSKEAPLSLIGRFGFRCGRDFDKMDGIETITGTTGLPIITEDTIAYIEAEVKDSLDLGTHILYICDVIDADILNDGEAMTYEYYHKVKRGTLSEKASHYIEVE